LNSWGCYIEDLNYLRQNLSEPFSITPMMLVICKANLKKQIIIIIIILSLFGFKDPQPFKYYLFQHLCQVPLTPILKKMKKDSLKSPCPCFSKNDLYFCTCEIKSTKIFLKNMILFLSNNLLVASYICLVSEASDCTISNENFIQ